MVGEDIRVVTLIVLMHGLQMLFKFVSLLALVFAKHARVIPMFLLLMIDPILLGFKLPTTNLTNIGR